MTRMIYVATLTVALALGGCVTDAPPTNIVPIATPIPTALPALGVDIEIDRHQLDPSVNWAGVTVEPETGRRLALDAWGQIHDVDTAETVWIGDPGATLGWGYTDLEALGGGRIALTSMSDGYVVELPDGFPIPYFCYEPGWFPEREPLDAVQLSNAVAHDRTAGRLYAQPRTIQNGGSGEVTQSLLAVYDEWGGADLMWWDLGDVSFVAGGLVVLESREAGATLLVGSGARLFTFNTETAELIGVGELGLFGVYSIEGLAIDSATDSLLVLSGNTVHELSLSALDLVSTR